MRPPRFEALRYVAAAGLIAAACGGLALALGGAPPDEAAPEVDSAVMVELPAADASAHPLSDADSGPEQSARAATQAAPDLPKPPDETLEVKPLVDKPQEQTPPVEAPPAPMSPEAPVEAPPAEPARPQATTASPQAATAAEEERAPAGAQAPDAKATDDGDDGRPRPSAHAITLWQRSLMKRLEGARRQAAATSRGTGTVTVAFRIDGQGALMSRRVAKTSGSSALDAAGLRLVQQASPFPTPPAGSSADDLSFTVPIRFR